MTTATQQSWAVEVKIYKRHRKWHRLSVSILQPMSAVAAQYAQQFAADNQVSPGCVAYALVNKVTGERIEHASDAEMNAPAYRY